MPHPKPAWRKVMNQPGSFTLQVLKAFQKNQGLLLAGALAYYILLSVIPLFTLVLLMLSHVVVPMASVWTKTATCTPCRIATHTAGLL